MKSNIDISGRVLAREERMKNPRMSRLGIISIGQKVRWCPQCRKPIPVDDIPEGQDSCPKCGAGLRRESPGKLNYFRFRSFPPDIMDAIRKQLGEKPIKVPFTWPIHPKNFITIGRECYQGSHLHCHNHWRFDEGSLKWVNDGSAERRVGKSMERRTIQCDPKNCPYVIGGDGIKPGQCGEVLIAYIWLYDVPGFELVRFKSGGINSINAFQDAVKKLVGLQGREWRPLKLELRIRSKAAKYMDQKTGDFRQTDIYEVYVHFPESVGALLEKQKSGTLKPGDIYIELPGGQGMKALNPPPASEGTYDALIDGPRESQPDTPPERESLPLSDLSGRETALPVQADEPASEDKIAEIKSLIAQLTESESEQKAIIKQLRTVFAIGKGKRFDSISLQKADKIIKHLQKRIENAKGMSGPFPDDDNLLDEPGPDGKLFPSIQ